MTPNYWGTSLFRKFGNRVWRPVVDNYMLLFQLIFAWEGMRMTLDFLTANGQCHSNVRVITTFLTVSAIITHGTFMVKVYWLYLVRNNEKDAGICWNTLLIHGLLSGSYCAVRDALDIELYTAENYPDMLFWSLWKNIEALPGSYCAVKDALCMGIYAAKNYLFMLFWSIWENIEALPGSFGAVKDTFVMEINAANNYLSMFLQYSPLKIGLLSGLCCMVCVAMERKINTADNNSKRILWYALLNIISGFCCDACVFFTIGMRTATDTATCVVPIKQLLPYCLEFVSCVVGAGWSWNYLRQEISDLDETSRPPSPVSTVEKLSDDLLGKFEPLEVHKI